MRGVSKVQLPGRKQWRGSLSTRENSRRCSNAMVIQNVLQNLSVAMKRKAPSGSPPSKAFVGFDNQPLLSPRLSDQIPQAQCLRGQQSSWQQPSELQCMAYDSQGKQFSHQQSQNQHLSEGLQGQRPLLQKPLNQVAPTKLPLEHGYQKPVRHEQRPLLQKSLNQVAPKKLPLEHGYQKPVRHDQRPLPKQDFNQEIPSKLPQQLRCHVCKVNCMDRYNLRQHYQGRKHKHMVQLEKRSGKKIKGDNNDIVWCKECNVPCMKQISLTQHCLGKKHLARIGMLAMGNDGCASGQEAVKIYCEREPNLHQAENNYITSMKVTSLIEQPARPVVQSQRLRTSNWPNCM